MLKTMTSAALALSLTIPFAAAQTTQTMQTAPMHNFMAQQTSGQWLASTYIDRTIYNPAGDKVGEVNDLLVDQTSGAISAAVIGVGGFLGMGEKNVAVPFRDVTSAMKDGKEWLTINATKDELKSAPDFVMQRDRMRAAVNTNPPAMPKTTILPGTAPVTTAVPSATPAAPAAQTANAVPPLAGANSFTEGQARSRIEAMGYSGVTGLTKDDQSVWHGTAMKDGKSTTVMLDYKGNVVTR